MEQRRPDGFNRLPLEYEIRGIWNNTQKIMLGVKISDTTFDHVIQTIDDLKPDMTFTELKDWAYIYDII